MADEDQDVALEEEEQQDQPAQEQQVQEPRAEEPSVAAGPSRKPAVPVLSFDDFGGKPSPAPAQPAPVQPRQARQRQGPPVLSFDDFSEGRVGFQEQQPEVNPETGEIELPAQQVAAPPSTAPVTKRARPATQLETGLYQDEDPNEFVSGIATSFATPEDLARYADAKAHGLSDNEAFKFSDNGIGNGRLGGLSTPELAGVAIPESVLRARYGNRTALWRTARIDVVDPSTGQRLRLPIVDTGPSGGQQAKGVAADFTPFVDSYFGNQGGGKKLLFKIVDNGGPDALKNPQDFADEQAALKQGVDVSALGKAQQQKQYRAISPAEQVAAEQAVTFGVQSQTDNLKQFQEEHPNPAEQLRLLEKPVEGISDDYRRAALKNLREEYTKEAQDFYKEPDPKKALDRLMSPAGPGELATEYFRQAQARYTRLDASVYSILSRGDENYLGQFVKDLEPNATGQARAEFINNLLKIPPAQQGAMLQAYIEHLPEGQQHKYDLATLVNGLQNIGSPEEQAKREAIVKSRLAQATQDMQSDPRLRGTAAEFLAGQAADITVNTMAAFLPPGFRETVFFAQLKQDSLEQLSRDHPDWSKDQLDELSTKVAAAQLLPQEALSAVTHGTFNRFLQGIPNRWARAGAVALTNTAIGAGAGGVQQATANVMTGKPAMENVPQAAAAGAIQGAVPGVVHGAGEVVRPRVPEEAPAPVVAPEQAPPAPPAEEAPAPVVPVEPPPSPVTQEDVARRAYEIYDERTRNGQPGTASDDYIRAQRELAQATEPPPAAVSEAEPINSAIANRYVQERMATGELGQIEPSQGKSTEDLVMQGLQMNPKQRDGLIDNFVKGKGGDLDQQGAAIRSREALLSEQARAASRAADADPTNRQLQAQAKAAAEAVTAFHNGPIKKFKQVWSDSGRALQREIPLDYTTLNGMREAYLKGNNKEAPVNLEPKLRQMAEAVTKSVDAERAALNKLGKEIENQTRGKPLPSDDQIRTRLMEIMKDLPCPA